MHQHKSTVYGLCTVSVDPLSQQHLISASSDQSVRLWSIDTFEEIQCDDRHKSEVTALHANFRHIMSGGADAKIKVKNVDHYRVKIIQRFRCFRFGISLSRSIKTNKKNRFCSLRTNFFLCFFFLLLSLEFFVFQMQRFVGSKVERFFLFVVRRTKTDSSSVVPKMSQELKEAAKAHVRELRQEFEKPIKFSTSRAKTWDTADSLVYNRKIGKFTRPVLMLAAAINMVSSNDSDYHLHSLVHRSFLFMHSDRKINAYCDRFFTLCFEYNRTMFHKLKS